MTCDGMRLKSNRWQRESTVIGILCGSVVAKMNLTWAGGSSNVLSSALKGAGRKHVDFIDNIDLITAPRRQVLAVFPQGTNVINAGIGGAVDFEHIRR